MGGMSPAEENEAQQIRMDIAQMGFIDLKTLTANDGSATAVRAVKHATGETFAVSLDGRDELTAWRELKALIERAADDLAR